MDRNDALDRVLRALALGVPPHLDVVEAAGLQGHVGLINEIVARSQRMEKALRGIIESDDMAAELFANDTDRADNYADRARAALSPVAPDQGEG